MNVIINMRTQGIISYSLARDTPFFSALSLGKSLKIYYALKPSDYATSPIPVQDASGKNIYKEIPVCFKVKSPLSLRRAKQLIADVCEHDNLEQGKVVPNNWAAELKDYKPTGAGGDDDGGDDE